MRISRFTIKALCEDIKLVGSRKRQISERECVPQSMSFGEKVVFHLGFGGYEGDLTQ